MTRRTNGLDEEFKGMQRMGERFLSQLNKHQEIRIQAWIKKLQKNNANNHIWKQNRNLYFKLLLQMLQQNNILPPFNKLPPEGHLKKLSPLDIPYPYRDRFLREQSNSAHRRTPSYSTYKPEPLQQIDIEIKPRSKNNYYLKKGYKDIKQKHKKNVSDIHNNQSNNNWDINWGRDNGYTVRIQENLDDQSSIYIDKVDQINQELKPNSTSQQHSLSVINFTTALNNQSNTIKEKTPIQKSITLSQMFGQGQSTSRKHKRHRRVLSQQMGVRNNNTIQKQDQKFINLLKKILKFLGKNWDVLQNKREYKKIMAQIIAIVDSDKENICNFKQKQFQPEVQTFRAYSNQIRKKFENTGQDSKEFINYLNSIRKQK